MVGAVRGLGGRARDLGRDRGSACSSGSGACKRRGADVAAFMDAGVPALLVAQAIGRVGNWFNQELFGKPTTLPWGLEIDPEHRPEQYLDSPTFHPVFLYEIIWNLTLAVRARCGSTGGSARRACSRSTSPATARSGSSRS